MNNNNLIKRIGLAGTALYLGACATTEGTKYNKDRTVEDIPQVVNEQILTYRAIGQAIADSKDKGTYNPNCPLGVIAELNRKDNIYGAARICSDAAKAYLLYKTIDNLTGGKGSSGSTNGNNGSGSTPTVDFGAGAEGTVEGQVSNGLLR